MVPGWSYAGHSGNWASDFAEHPSDSYVVLSVELVQMGRCPDGYVEEDRGHDEEGRDDGEVDRDGHSMGLLGQEYTQGPAHAGLQ